MSWRWHPVAPGGHRPPRLLRPRGAAEITLKLKNGESFSEADSVIVTLFAAEIDNDGQPVTTADVLVRYVRSVDTPTWR